VRVLLVDKASSARQAVRRADDARRPSVPGRSSPVVEQGVDRVELRFRYGDAVERRSARPVILMTQRRRLDAFLWTLRESGVEVREDDDRRDGGSRRRCGRRGQCERDDRPRPRARCGDRARRRLRNVPYGVASRERYGRRAVIELATFGRLRLGVRKVTT
jgi:hypothetical protein